MMNDVLLIYLIGAFMGAVIALLGYFWVDGCKEAIRRPWWQVVIAGASVPAIIFLIGVILTGGGYNS